MSAKTPADLALERVATVLYTILVLAMLLSFVPGLRRRLLEAARMQLYFYELGRHELRDDRARSIYRRLMATAEEGASREHQ